jgi:uncharacterized protein YjbI with pentapeptide repeats
MPMISLTARVAICISMQAVFASQALAVVLPARTRCTIAKLKAASSALQCALRESSKQIAGGAGDVARCAEKLSMKFASAESRGDCPTTGDAALASSRAEAAANGVMVLMGGTIASSDDELGCLRKKAKLVATYARCQTAALTTRLANTYLGERRDFDICRDLHASGSTSIETDYACAVAGEAESVQESSSPGFAFLPGAELGGSLDDAPLAGAYLVGAVITGATIGDARFRGADLSMALLTNITDTGPRAADLRDVDLSGATLENARLENSLLGGANLATTTLNGLRANGLPECPASLPPSWVCRWGVILGPKAQLSALDFSGLDLTGLDLSYASLAYTDLRNAVLRDADLSHASLERSQVAGADMTGADLSNTHLYRIYGSGIGECPALLTDTWRCLNRNLVGSGAILADCDLAGQDLSQMSLSDAYFARCDLSGADLSGTYFGLNSFADTDLTGANLSDAYLYEPRFYNCDLTGASFAGASFYRSQWSNVTCPDGASSVSDHTCCGHHVGDPPDNCSY